MGNSKMFDALEKKFIKIMCEQNPEVYGREMGYYNAIKQFCIDTGTVPQDLIERMEKEVILKCYLR